MSDDPGELLMAALREKARGMSDAEWSLFVAQTRPPDLSQPFTDGADRIRAVRASIASKQAAKRQQRAQPQPTQADLDALDEQIQAAQESGDVHRSISLKRQKHQQLAKGAPR